MHDKHSYAKYFPTILINLYIITYIGVDKTDCQRDVIKEAAGNLSSLFYPNNYPANLNCDWTIEIPSSQHILLNVYSFNTRIGDTLTVSIC